MHFDNSVALPQKLCERSANEILAKKKNRDEEKERSMIEYYCSWSFAPRYLLHANDALLGSQLRVFTAAHLRSSTLSCTG
jgi:hypothetical protein